MSLLGNEHLRYVNDVLLYHSGLYCDLKVYDKTVLIVAYTLPH